MRRNYLTELDNFKLHAAHPRDWGAERQLASCSHRKALLHLALWITKSYIWGTLNLVRLVALACARGIAHTRASFRPCLFAVE